MNERMNDKNLYSAIIRNAEALGGKNVSHDAVKRVSFQLRLKSFHSGSELTTLSSNEFQTVGAATEKAQLAKLFEERPASERDLTAAIEREQ